MEGIRHNHKTLLERWRMVGGANEREGNRLIVESLMSAVEIGWII